MLSAKLGHRLDKPLSWLIKIGPLRKIHPTALTLMGLVFNLIAAIIIIFGYWRVASLLILTAGFFDMLDGTTARTYNKTSWFGGFLDSVIDRYSDMSLLIAFIIFYAIHKNTFMVTLCSVASLGTFLIPYTRAKAEIFLNNCNVGIMERAERIILLSAGCLLNIVEPVFWILAVFTHLTVLQRIHYTWKMAQKLEKREMQT